MDLPHNTSIVKLPASNTKEFYILHSIWDSDEIKINIFDLSRSDKNQWSGVILREEIEKAATELEIPFEIFYNECKLALCTNGGLADFNYNVIENSFKWEKVGEFKEEYGSVKLIPAYNLETILLLSAINLVDKTKNQFDVLVLDHQKQNIEYKMLIESYEKCITHKNTVEKELLTKFAVLLNSKKEKIAELQELLLEKEVKFSEEVTDKPIELPDDTGLDLMLTQSTSRLKILPKRKKLIEEEEKEKKRNNDREMCTNEGRLQRNHEEVELLNSQDMFDAM